MRTVLALLLVFACSGQAYAAERSVVLYRIGEGGEQAWTLLKQGFESKGYGLTIVQGETAIERHVEKVSRINRGPGSVFIAVEMVPGEKQHIVVAEPALKKGEGRILSIDEIPARFAAESDRLATDVAGPFKVGVKHLPLFPLLGVDMPGIALKLEFREDEAPDVMTRLVSGVEKYFSERTKK